MTQDELKQAWQALGKRVADMAGIVEFVHLFRPNALLEEIDRIKLELDRLTDATNNKN